MCCTQVLLVLSGNSWGTFPNGTSCVGCGNQEEFYGCADVQIIAESDATTSTTSTTTSSVTGQPATLPPGVPGGADPSRLFLS